MMSLSFILQSPVASDNTSALSSLNNLGLAIFLVGIGLILLMAAHWYRMKDNLARKERQSNKYGDKSGADEITQLQYLTREELKQMVLKEKEEKESKESKAKIDAGQTGSTADGPFGREAAPSPGAMAYRRSASLLAPEAPVPSPQPVATVPTPPVGDIPTVAPPRVVTPSSPKTELLVRLAMAEVKETDDEEKKDGPPKPPEKPYHDRIERSILSNESLEHWKGKSRKI